jgi:NAD+ synthetase
MKFHPESQSHETLPKTAELLKSLRERRNFNPETYMNAKAQVLNDYMRQAGLKTCVVAVSGGIDSALVLSLVNYAKNLEGSPIEQIWPMTLPVYHDNFTKNQDVATARANELCANLGLDCLNVDVTPVYDLFKKTVDGAVGIEGEEWAAGQGVAYLRTPFNYYLTSLASQIGKPAIVVGTTNRDEGAYLGYVGKASDGIVDVQLISDLHKSEVRSLSGALGVPQSIMEAAPTGDMFDGRVDEEVFGTTYDYVELFLMLKSLTAQEADAYLNALGEAERASYDEAARSLEELHSYNSHKYLVGSPAVHLDILESGVPGGWTHASTKLERLAKGKEFFVNPFVLSEELKSAINERAETFPTVTELDMPKGRAFTITEAVSADVANGLVAEADSHGWIPVGVDGILSNYKEGDPVGSLRASTFSPELADHVWARLQPHLEATYVAGNDPQNDMPPGSVWRPIGVSPLARLIRYDMGGQLIPHYDAPFMYGVNLITQKTVVIYLEGDEVSGGRTRFLYDERLSDPISTRDLSDRSGFASEDDVMIGVDPHSGSALVFDHRILHDGEAVLVEDGSNKRKVIIRMDVVYERCW